MKFTGQNILHAPVDRAWDALLDPGVLVRTIPGCERLEATGDNAYAMTVTAGVASIKGTYAGSCVLADLRERESLVMKLDGAGAPYVVVPYADRMELAYAAADLVVCRAGANTVCELTAVGLPAVYVPLPIGNGEQRLNATDVVDAGGALLVDNADVDTAWVQRVVVPLVKDAERLEVAGAWTFGPGVRVVGEASLSGDEAPGRVEDTVLGDQQG